MSARRKAAVQLFTIGYEGKTPSELVRVLSEAGIRRLVDVRLQPVSRRKGFSLMALFERLRKAGITYEHMRDLGNPTEIRALFHDGKLDTGRRKYRSLLMNGSSEAVDVLLGLAQLERTAVLCRERDAPSCHRAVVAEVVAERSTRPLEIVHL